ncbi:MAG: hypothetical protein JW915_16855 [Chitinispirillaceae bacterium]|nr:hypothetical protein [Chitinispirillaceae bacterium]
MKFDGKVFIHSTLEEGYDFFITDKWKKKRHFKISTFPLAGALVSEAIEVVNNGKDEPYIFSIRSPFDSDIEYVELLLKAKIKRGINKRYLAKYRGTMILKKENELVGRITYNDDPDISESSTMLVVDGKRVTMEKFWQMLSQYEGWTLKLQITDRTDE